MENSRPGQYFRAKGIQPALVGLIALVVFVATMPRKITLEDAGLFQMVCHLGGISHPPGYPLFTLLCQGMVQTPTVWNGNLVSAIFGALAAAACFEVCLLIRQRVVFAWVASLAWVFSATFWSQAIIIEVYTLAAFLFMVCWWLTLKFTQTLDTRYWYLAALVFGLGMSNHWPLMLLSSMALVATVTPAFQRLLSLCLSLRFILVTLACLLAGLSSYISLWLHPDPVIGVFGGIHSWHELANYVARSAYSDNNSAAVPMDRLRFAGWLLKQSLVQGGIVSAPFVIIGLVRSLRSLPKSLTIALVLLWFGGTWLLVGLLDFDYSQFSRAIFKPYPIVAFVAVAIWFALGVEWIIDYLGRHTRHAPAMIGMAAVLVVLIANLPTEDRHGDELIDTYMRMLLQSLPPNAVLFVRGDNATGPIGYLHYVEGVRPDIEVRDWDNLVFDNRLASPFAPDAASDQALQSFLKASVRPVFVTEDRLKPRVDYGVYFRLVPEGETGFAFPKQLQALMRMMVKVYEEGDDLDPHEQHFVFQRLLQFSQQYIGYAFRHRGKDIPPDVAAGLLALKETFPGKLITLQKLVPLGGDSQQRAMLLGIARQAEHQIPEFVTPEALAVFYEMYGRILMEEPAEPAMAEVMFRKSLAAYPAAVNSSACLLQHVLVQQGKEDEADRVASRYAAAKCGAQQQ